MYMCLICIYFNKKFVLPLPYVTDNLHILGMYVCTLFKCTYSRCIVHPHLLLVSMSSPLLIIFVLLLLWFFFLTTLSPLLLLLDSPPPHLLHSSSSFPLLALSFSLCPLISFLSSSSYPILGQIDRDKEEKESIWERCTAK